jgi:hypothetical protein
MQQVDNKVTTTYSNANSNNGVTVGPSLVIPYKNVEIQAICPDLQGVKDGCTRYTRGFDVTGAVTETDFTFPQVNSACDCIQECLNRPGTCANYGK